MARRRPPVRRRSRRRRNDPAWFLWPIAAILLIVMVKRLIEFITANWPLVIVITIVTVIGIIGALLLRARVIEARRQEWLRDNARLEKADRMTGSQFEASSKPYSSVTASTRCTGSAAAATEASTSSQSHPPESGSSSSARGGRNQLALRRYATFSAHCTPTPVTVASWSPQPTSPAPPDSPQRAPN